MSKNNLVIVALIFFVASVSCKSFMPANTTDARSTPAIDFETPGKGLDVEVQLDKKQTASGKISPSGGSLSLTAADGSKFTLDVPAKALDTETTITMTAVQSLDGSPLDNNKPTAVQLEPSGLRFKEMATLTIVPAKEIPINEQLIFGYEKDGKDYHLAVVDHKSEEIRIKLMHFSGAGVGSASDVAWAANLAIRARAAEARIEHKLGEYLQKERMAILLGNEGSDDFGTRLKSALDDYEDQVALKDSVAAELDCKHARRAAEGLLGMERNRQLLGLPGTTDFGEKFGKLVKIAEGCKKAFRVSAVSNSVSFSGEICSLDFPFSLDATFPGGTAKTSFTPSVAERGTTTVSGGGGGCDHSGAGKFSIMYNEDGSGTLTWTTNDTISCPGYSNSRSVTFTLPLQPAPELSCP